MNIKELEIIDNEFVEQLQGLLNNSFSGLPIGFQVKYIIGENELKERGLYFEITSKITNVVYGKFMKMKLYQILADLEDKFMNEVLNDLVLAGITFLYTEKLKYFSLNNANEDAMKIRKLFVN